MKIQGLDQYAEILWAYLLSKRKYAYNHLYVDNLTKYTMIHIYGYCHHHNICTQWECNVNIRTTFLVSCIINLLHWILFLHLSIYVLYIYGNSDDFLVLFCFIHLLPFSWIGILIKIVWHLANIIQSQFWGLKNYLRARKVRHRRLMVLFGIFYFLWLSFGLSFHESSFLNYILEIALLVDRKVLFKTCLLVVFKCFHAGLIFYDMAVSTKVMP